MSQFLSRTAIAAFCALAISSTAAAQASLETDSSAVPAPAESRVVSTIMAQPVNPDLIFRPARQEMAPVVQGGGGFSRPLALLIVGGALIVTGLLVDGDASPILYLAGAGIGGYGLYLYLQSPDTTMRR